MSEDKIAAPSGNFGLFSREFSTTLNAVEVDKRADVEAMSTGIINPGTNGSCPPFYKLSDIRLAEQLPLTHLHTIAKHFPGTPLLNDALAHWSRLPSSPAAEPENCGSWQEAACRMLTDKQLKQLVDSLVSDEIEMPAYLQQEIDKREHLAYLIKLEEE